MVIYVCMFLSIWTLGIIVIRLNHNRHGRFYGYTLLAAGCGSFAFSLQLTILPFLNQLGYATPLLAESLRVLSIAACYVYWIVFPWFYWMTSVFFNESNIRTGWYRVTPLIALATAIIHFARYPLHEIHVDFLRIPAGVYFGLGMTLYLRTYLKERHRLVKKGKFRTVILFNTAIAWAYISDFVGVAKVGVGPSAFTVASNEIWKYNYLLVAAFVLLHLYFNARYGFIGIRMRLERQKHHYSMQALTMGTTILNQTLKIEIRKIDQLGEQIKQYAACGRRNDALKTSATLSGVASHLLDVLNRIKEQSDDIQLQESEVHIARLLQEIIAEFMPLLQERSIRLSADLYADAALWCDRTHIREMFCNLLLNAVEATEPGDGVIKVQTEIRGKRFIVDIQDNGCGIPKKDFSRVFEPFYTTKRGPSHYGLGLSYCSGVMRKHGGRVYIAASTAGTGTTVAFWFPGRRVIKVHPPASITIRL